MWTRPPIPGSTSRRSPSTPRKTVQDYFLRRLKADGEPVLDGDEDMDCVYVYKKSERTVP